PSKSRSVLDAIEGFPKIRSTVSRTDLDWKAWADSVRTELTRLGLRMPTNRRAQSIFYRFFTRRGLPLDQGHDFIAADISKDESDLGRWYADVRLKGVIQHVARSH